MSSEKMDPQIWSKLPQELLEHILAFLPLKTFFNLRSTCKLFNSLIFSPSFISKHNNKTNSETQTSFLLLSHPQFLQHFALYDSVLCQWRTLSLSLSPSSSLLASHLHCSTNGLLCFSLPNSSSLLVSNVLSRSSQIINFPSYPFAFESISMIPSLNGYKIFIICSGSSSNSVFIYDSVLRSWTRFAGFDSIPRQNSHQQGIFSNGSIYFTTPEPFSIVGFDLKTGNWGNSIDRLPEDLTFLRLISSCSSSSNSSDGKLYLIGGIGRHGISRSLKLWELNGGREDWIEIGRLPEMMCRKFMSVCYHNYEHVYCFVHEGMICICCYTWPEVLYYKVARQTWHWLPRCPSLPEKWSCGFKWFSFVPNLYASV